MSDGQVQVRLVRKFGTKDNLISKFNKLVQTDLARKARVESATEKSRQSRTDLFYKSRFRDIQREQAIEEVANAFADEDGTKLYDLVVTLYQEGNELLTAAFEDFIAENKDKTEIVDRVVNNESEETLLHIAALSGNCRMVQHLLANGANALVYDSYEMSLFDNSIQAGDLESASFLLPAMNLFETNLIEQSVENYLTQILIRYENGIDPHELLDFYKSTFADNYYEKTDKEIYFKRSFTNNPILELKIILDILSKTSAADDLFAEAQQDSEVKARLMQVIQGHFMDKLDEIVDEQGNTFLHLAAKYNDEESVNFLLGLKANPELNNYDRMTALEMNFLSENLSRPMSCANMLLRSMAINPRLHIEKIATSCRDAINHAGDSNDESVDKEEVLREFYEGNLALAFAMKTHRHILPLQPEEDLSEAFARLRPLTDPSEPQAADFNTKGKLQTSRNRPR